MSYTRQTITIRQTLPEFSVTQAAGATAYYSGAATISLTPTFNLVDQGPSLATVFDQYKIDRITWRFRPQFRSENFVAGTDYVPQIYTVVDYDDGVVLPSLAQARQYANCVTRMFEDFEVSIVPHVADAIYGNGAFNGYGNIIAPWLDCSSNLVPHYGLKLAITAGAGGQTRLQGWIVSTVMMISFRNVR